MYYLVWVGSRRFHGDAALTYSHADDLNPGTVVKVPLGRGSAHGIIKAKVHKPSFPTKAILHAWPNIIVPDTSTQLLLWMAAYYPSSLGQTTELFLPPALTIQQLESSDPTSTRRLTPLPPLTQAQTEAIDTISSANTSVLLHGITGSGKTRVYLEAALQTIADNTSVLVLTPEIGLTTPLANQFRKHTDVPIITLHSGMTPAERRTAWLQVHDARKPVVVVGPRSALFLPFRHLGLIVIDEAHDTAYKQSQAPRYNALRVAGKLREIHRAKLIQGTATPLVAERHLFESKQLPIIEMRSKAIITEEKLPKTTQIIDSRNRQSFNKSPYLSDALVAAIQTAVDNHEQSLLFLNKRGSARLILCQSCGWRAVCPKCDTALTFHADTHNLRCHSCETSEPVPSDCPVCGQSDVVFRSIGTKALASELSRLFPQAMVARFDGDTQKSDGLVARSNELHRGDIDIIIGTQTVTKGFDLPKLSVVGVVQADTSLGIPDFTAHERTFQLISQVSGRVGRGHRSGTLIIQTFNPDNTAIRYAADEDYTAFYREDLAERKRYVFPPFTHLMAIRCSRASRESAEDTCIKLSAKLKKDFPTATIEGPSPRFNEKQGGKYTWQLIIKAPSRSILTTIAAHLPSGWTYDLDPIDLL
jgi:primosomal protein N' (replication factor Y)